VHVFGTISVYYFTFSEPFPCIISRFPSHNHSTLAFIRKYRFRARQWRDDSQRNSIRSSMPTLYFGWSNLAALHLSLLLSSTSVDIQPTSESTPCNSFCSLTSFESSR
jgi:hypothetical protein